MDRRRDPPGIARGRPPLTAAPAPAVRPRDSRAGLVRLRASCGPAATAPDEDAAPGPGGEGGASGRRGGVG